jgi:polysaccharide biosynthesis/export protein
MTYFSERPIEITNRRYPGKYSSSRSLARIIMRFGGVRKLGTGILFVVLSNSVLTQAPTSGQAEHGLPAAAVASSTVESLAESVSKPHDNSFVIGNDDRLAINVWKEPDLTRTIPVRSDGKISLPLVGELQATGRTPLQLERAIEVKLLTYITDPEVTVIVEQINSQKFNILGQVTKPGSYSLASATTILDAIAAAGGFRDFAKQKSVYILRQNASGGETRVPFNYKDVIKGKNPQQNIKLQPGDTIVVP